MPSIRRCYPAARSACVAACFLLAYTCPIQGQPPARAKPTPIYKFDAAANDLLRELFPQQVRIAGHTNAYAWRARKPQFKNVDAVFDYHTHALDAADTRASWWDVEDDVLESAWLARRREEGWPGALLRRSPRVTELAGGLGRAGQAFATPLEKALFQRDVLQMCMLVDAAVKATDQPKDRAQGERALAELAALWRRLLLTEGEYEHLTSGRPKRIPGRFTPASRFDLTDDYLPARVLGDEPGWYAMVPAERPTAHFEDFAGRSFVRIYIKPAGWTQERFHRYWDGVAQKFGPAVTRDGRVPPLPARTETLLLRTFGTFLQDGSYADSGYPEEALLRLFKYEDTRLDTSTSDYRGTLLYRYRMRRRDLLDDPPSLGISRVRDDDPQFFGFLSEVPDPARSYAAALTTMRNNCVGCHSELFYGASTVFSLGPKRHAGQERQRLEGGLLHRSAHPDRYRLLTPEFTALRPYLKE